MAFVVAVAQRKGGAGKSTVAATLATTFAAQGLRVALLDTDPQQTLARWQQERATAGTRAAALTFEAPSGWRLPATIERMARTHDVVVLDTPTACRYRCPHRHPRRRPGAGAHCSPPRPMSGPWKGPWPWWRRNGAAPCWC
jgi:hypothetical protein